MIVFHYEIIEKIFGTYVADHFDEIWTILMIVGMFAVILSKKSNRFRRSQGKEPTYEEWKAAREAEQRSDTESSN